MTRALAVTRLRLTNFRSYAEGELLVLKADVAVRIGANEGDGCPIVLSIEIFANCEPNERTQIVFNRGVPSELVKIFGQWDANRSGKTVSNKHQQKRRGAPPGVGRPAAWRRRV